MNRKTTTAAARVKMLRRIEKLRDELCSLVENLKDDLDDLTVNDDEAYAEARAHGRGRHVAANKTYDRRDNASSMLEDFLDVVEHIDLPAAMEVK
jgi:uncharacterized protein YjiS (DUF1127 family)